MLIERLSPLSRPSDPLIQQFIVFHISGTCLVYGVPGELVSVVDQVSGLPTHYKSGPLLEEGLGAPLSR
jgi:hypothetical protein